MEYGKTFNMCRVPLLLPLLTLLLIPLLTFLLPFLALLLIPLLTFLLPFLALSSSFPSSLPLSVFFPSLLPQI